MSFEDFERKAAAHKPRQRCWSTSAGTSPSTRTGSRRRAAPRTFFLFEDCAHAHGASWNDQKPGTFGDAGAYSFYATKTVSTGEGGVLVSPREDVLEFARKYRDYGKPDYDVDGLNFRMSEFTAAVALAQAERLEEIVRWKNDAAARCSTRTIPAASSCRTAWSAASTSTSSSTRSRSRAGRSNDQPCHRIMGTGDDPAQRRLGGRAPLVRPVLTTGPKWPSPQEAVA